jgi:hypothetical protein
MPSFMHKPDRWAALVGFALLAAPATSALAQPPVNVGAGQNQAQFQQGAGRIITVPAGGVVAPQTYVPPYNPYFPGYGDPFGGALNGQANLTNSQGQIMKDQQAAFLQREQVRAAKTDNRRRTFDEYLYEKEHTPTAEEDRQRAQREYLARARNSPPIVEVWSGTALNTILQDLKKGLGASGNAENIKSLPLEEEMLKHINVTSGRGDGNAGLLKNGAKLTWPDALSGSDFKDGRDRVSDLMSQAVKQAEFNGQVDGNTRRDLEKAADEMGRQLKRNIDTIGVNDYIEGKQFLNNLDSSITILKQQDVGNYFNGKYQLKAKDVHDLVKNMTEKGLTFASATPGDESAYNALYQAMANYDNAVQSLSTKQQP